MRSARGGLPGPFVLVDHDVATYSVSMVRSDSSPQELLPTTCIRRKDFLAADVGNKHVLMNVEKETYIGLDDVGRNIWARLEEPQTIATLSEGLTTVYQVPDRPQFERDITEFIAKLRLLGLVETIP